MADSSDTKKIWITLPLEKAEILDILAGDSPEKTRSNRKSYFIERLIDEYLENHRERLKEDETEIWNKILDVKKKYAEKYTAYSKSIEDKIAAIDVFVKNISLFFKKYGKDITSHYPEIESPEDFKTFWELTKSIRHHDDIDEMYELVESIQKKMRGR